jgi:hypothetical protein
VPLHWMKDPTDESVVDQNARWQGYAR